MALEHWLLPLVPVVCAFFAGEGIFHYFQLESYQFPGFFRTLKRNRNHAWLPGLCVTVASLALYYGFDQLTAIEMPLWAVSLCVMGLLLIAAGMGYAIGRAFAEKRPKKKFVYTSRVKRLYGVFFVGACALSLAMGQTAVAILPALWPLALPIVVALAGLLAWPLEKLISEFYFQDAHRKLLASPDLLRIGITGSYGKTSVKHILGTILAEKFPTLVTPASFNTPMGVSRAIRESLTPTYQVFVAEMGARHVGDIREMCRLVKPTIGILTSVGPQHLDTFKTVDRIAKTKYELIQALPQENSHCYFYNDNGTCKQMHARTQKAKTLVSLEKGQGDVWCEDISVSPKGSHFTLHIQDKGSIECQTALLGEHNIQNILLAAAVASDLKLTLKQIAHGISKLQPVKSRLELITSPGGFTIINDGFNSNPVGAKAALKVLSAFPARRIVITPGMVELGEQEAEYNRELGQEIARNADIAIVVGKKRAIPILEGLRAGGFGEDQIFQVSCFDESTAVLHSFVKPEDTVLYENDLPDNYQEA